LDLRPAAPFRIQLEVQLPVKAKKRLRRWFVQLEADAVGAEFALSEALRVALTPEAAEAIERADEYARLRDEHIGQDPAIIGGEPVIRGTRVPVRTIAGLIEQGESRKVMRADYPHVPEAAYPVARSCGRTRTRAAAVRHHPGDDPRTARPPRAQREADESLAARSTHCRQADATRLGGGRPEATLSEAPLPRGFL
jgi:uncharacterized protein (DUF433 family)